MLTVKQVSEIFGKSGRHIRRMCDAGQLPGSEKIGDNWLIPADADSRLAAVAASGMIDTSCLADVSAEKRDAALARLGLVQEFERFCVAFMRNESKGRCEAVEVFCSSHKIARRTFERHMERWRKEGLVGLVDSRGKTRGKDVISDDAFEMFKSLYLDQRRPSVKTCWQNVRFVNSDQGRRWQIPSLRSMCRISKQKIPYFAEVLHREGIAAYEAKCAPFVETDPDSIAPGSVWVGDHHQFNCWIRHRGQWLRPWLTGWEDMRSRCIVGRDINVNPNQSTIMLAAKRGMEKYGPPDSVKIDNGRDYDSAMWTGVTKRQRRQIKAGYIDEPMIAGLYAMLGIGVSFAKPYHPQSKPIERMFDTVDRQFTKTMKTYCGKNSAVKPEKLNEYLKTQKAIDEALSLEEFTRAFDRYVQTYNNTIHAGRGMEGATPNQIMTQRTSRRVLADGVLELLCGVWSQELSVGKNGVRFKGMWYGQFDLELAAWQGRNKKVRVKYDPEDIRQIWVYDAATMKLITAAEQGQLIRYGSAVNEESLREAMRKKSRAEKVAKEFRNSRLTANMDLTDLTIRAMADAAEPEPKEQPHNLRPVKTVMDRQVKLHHSLELTKQVKMAAGAENVNRVLDIDLTVLRPENRREKIKLFE